MIPNKRKLLARAFFYSGALYLFRHFKLNPFIGLTYHRIRHARMSREGEIFPFSEDVFGQTEEQFHRQMRWIKKNMHALSEEELIYSITHEKSLPPRSVMITFDDGYIDTYTIAYPILKSLEIPSILFIPTKSILDRELGWWDLISYFIKQTKKRSFTFRSISYDVSDNPSQRMATIIKIQDRAKTLSIDSMTPFIQELSNSCEVAFPSHDKQGAELMTLEQIVEVSNNGMSIGSHTHSHKILASLTLKSQREELVVSKEILERILSKPIRSIAFPVGGYEHFFAETKIITRDAGYQLAFSNLTGTPNNNQLDPYDIQRIAPPLNLSHFSSALVIPEIFNESSCRLKTPPHYWSDSCQNET